MTSPVAVQATAVAPYVWPKDVYPEFTNKTGDFYTNEAIANPNILAVTMPSVWSSSVVNYNVTFTGGLGTTIVGVTLVNLPPLETGLTAERINATTYNISGSISAATGEYFNFLLRDKTYANLSPINDQDWLAVIKWNPATQPWEKESLFSFDVTYESLDEFMVPTETTTSLTVSQYQYWSWEPSLAGLQTLVTQGGI